MTKQLEMFQLNMFKEYEAYVKKNWFVSGVLDKTKQLLYASLGLAGEAGESVELVKKWMRTGYAELEAERKEAIKLELGDVLYYLTAIASQLGYSLSDVATANISKLDARRRKKEAQEAGLKE